MKHLKELFDFRGMAPRAEYWAIHVGGAFFIILIIAITAGLMAMGGPIFGLLDLLAIPILVAIAAVDVRRLHDRGKSAWWMLLFWGVPFLLSFMSRVASGGGEDAAAGATVLFSLPAFVLSVWAFIELGCLAGVKGANKYNPRVDTSRVAQVFE